MTRIDLGSNGYFIESDQLNHTLKQTYTYKNKGGDEKETERVCGYYGSFEHAVWGFLKRSQLDDMDGLSLNLDEFVKSIEESNKAAVSAFKALLEGAKHE